MKEKRKFLLPLRAVLLVLALFSLLATTGILDGRWMPNVFEMFTTLSNCLYAAYLLAEVVWLCTPNGRAGRRTALCPALKGVAVMSITITFLIVVFVLKSGVRYTSWQDSSLLGLHFIVPIAAILDFLFLDEPGRLRPWHALLWVASPLVYGAWALLSPVMGNLWGIGLSGNSRYPYPFLDVDKLGLKQVLVSGVLILAVFFILGLLFYGLDVLRARRKTTSHAA